MDENKELTMVSLCLADPNILSKALRVLKPEYFSRPMDRVVEFIINYYNEHKGSPPISIVRAETGVTLESYTPDDVDEGIRSWTVSEVEGFCRRQALNNAILECASIIHDGDLTQLATTDSIMRDALTVRIDSDIGINLFEDVEKRITETASNMKSMRIGIKPIDDIIGDVVCGSLTVVVGETSSGKSVTLGNIAERCAIQGKDVMIFSLELGESMYAKRLDTIVSGHNIKEHAKLASEIANYFDENRDRYANIHVKRKKYGSTPADIRADVVEYALINGKYPDALVVDYLGLMGSGSKFKTENKFNEDEKKAMELRDMGHEFGMYVFTAAQLSREGYGIIDIRPNHIAGGISLINACDAAFAIANDDADIENNQVQVVQMKVRDGEKTRKPIIMYRCPKTLRLSGTPFSDSQRENSFKNMNQASDVTGSSKAAVKRRNKQPTKEETPPISNIGDGNTLVKQLLKM